jgi:hypothetical protein
MAFSESRGTLMIRPPAVCLNSQCLSVFQKEGHNECFIAVALVNLNANAMLNAT